MPRLTPHQEKALDYARHISLTANAGSGKTFVLTRRFLDIVLHENISLRNIAAITFTNLAASELYNEIAGVIDDRLNSEQDEIKRLRLEDVRKQLISASICTIHSFCADILREYPVEAGIDPGFVTLDEYSEGNLVAESVNIVLNDPALRETAKILSRAFDGVERLRDSLISLIRNRELLVSIRESLYVPNDDDLLASLTVLFKNSTLEMYDLFFEDMTECIAAVQRSAEKKRSEAYGAINAKLDRIRILDDPYLKIIAVCEIPELMITKSGTGFFAKYIPKAEQDELLPLLKKIRKYRTCFESAAGAFDEQGNIKTETFRKMISVIRGLLDLYDGALTAYTRKKNLKGALDFTDMMLYVRDILTQEPVRQGLAGRFKYIMVDEYQDTNELQYEIFLPLLDDLRRGNLFVVGDEKQSIYSFRNSEVEIFARTAKDIQNAAPEGKSLSLPDSFRMAPGLCLFINNLFEKLFDSPIAAFNEVAHEETICAKDTESPGSVEFLVSAGSAQTETELVIARMIEMKRENPELRWGDFAVLSRYKEIFEEYRKLLPRYNIPFTITGGRGFFQSQCIYDIANYLHFLIAPDNDAALAGILRSPFFMLSDVNLFNVRQACRGTLFQCLCLYASGHPEKGYVNSAVKTLEEHITFASVHQITEIVNRIYDDTQYLAVIANRTDAGQIEANIKKLIGLARDFEKEGFRVLFDFVDFLKSATVEIENESFASVNTSDDSVQLMSIHASKGLQFKIVFLVETNRSYFKAGGFESRVLIDKKFGLLFSLPGGPDYFNDRIQPPFVTLAKYIRRQKAAAEEKRLLYVALTRAKEQVIIAASLKASGTATANSYFELIASVYNINKVPGAVPLAGNVRRLVQQGDIYCEEIQYLTLNIPVKDQCREPFTVIGKTTDERPSWSFDLGPLPLSGTEQIISASQFSAFIQCPMKYFLMYRARLNELFPLPDEYQEMKEESRERDVEKPYIKAPALRGIILHKLLEMNCKPEEANSRISELAGMAFNKNENSFNEFAAEIMDAYSTYYASEQRAVIENFLNPLNEYAILAAEKAFNLYGIIDKLILLEDRILIIDYKSDAKKPDKEKIDSYISQLKFYAFIASKKYPDYEIIESRLVFISFPDSSAVFRWNKTEMLQIRNQVHDMHSRLLGEEYVKNTAHCPQCIFAANHIDCIVR